jgi:hypothetical protein
MEKKVAKTKTKEGLVIPGRSLVDLVFSWSIGHVLNKDLYKNQVCMHAIVVMFMCMMALQIFNFLHGLFFWSKSGCLVGRILFFLIKFGNLIKVKSFRDIHVNFIFNFFDLMFFFYFFLHLMSGNKLFTNR